MTTPRTRSQDMNRYRDEAGVIATLRDLDTGEEGVIHEPGYVGEAVKAVCSFADALGPSWRVLTLSTPRTIARDLQGTRWRQSFDHGRTGRDAGAASTSPVTDVERNLLSRAGRLDLLPPARLL